ncbi:MAG: ABC transporter ATP-binding protein, partial [bacterium]
ILGRSGCGKSVLLKLILRLIVPDEGRIIIDGVDTTGFTDFEMNKIRKRIGILFQGSALFDSFTVEENVAYPLIEHSKIMADEIRRRVAEVLSFVELDGTEKLMPSELSGGMKKRVALARAIITNPDYIFFDEPTTGLDPITARKIDELIVRTSKEFGTTIVVVTHDLVSAFAVGSRFAFIHDGKITFSGSRDELLKSDRVEVQEFLRQSEWKRNSLQEGVVEAGL